MQKAVYALHDYYVDEKQGNLQYDDSGARSTIMNDRGYTLMWAGNSTWKELPGQVELARASTPSTSRGTRCWSRC